MTAYNRCAVPGSDYFVISQGRNISTMRWQLKQSTAQDFMNVLWRRGKNEATIGN